MSVAIEIIGWMGSIFVIVAYGLNSYQKLKSDSLAFILLNLIGGIFLVIYTYYCRAFASTFINVIWVIIAIPALYRFSKK